MQNKVEVITSSDFRNSEIHEIKELFKSAGYDAEVDNAGMIRESAEQLRPDVWVFIGGAAFGAFFNGFFQKAGSDAWDRLKKCVKKLSSIKNNTQVRLHIRHENEKQTIIPLPDDSQEREVALDSLLAYLENKGEINNWIFFNNGKWGRYEEHLANKARDSNEPR